MDDDDDDDDDDDEEEEETLLEGALLSRALGRAAAVLV
jgi:hypothetical protein